MTVPVELLDVDDLPEPDRKYPVIVEYTSKHVVWVEAGDQEDAVEQLACEPYESTNDHETLASTWWEVRAPDRYSDWSDIEDGEASYRGTSADEHVRTHREHRWRVERAHLEATVVDEEREIAAGRLASADRHTCSVCPDWLVDGHADTPRHVSQARWAAIDAQREAERSAAGGAS